MHQRFDAVLVSGLPKLEELIDKTIAAKATPSEKAALFGGTAKRVYGLEI